MVGILGLEMLATALFKAASLEESSSWLSLMMIFKDIISLESAAALLGVLGLVVEGLGVATTGAKEEDAGEADVVVGVVEVEADDENEAIVAATPAEPDPGAAATVDAGRVPLLLLETDV